MKPFITLLLFGTIGTTTFCQQTWFDNDSKWHFEYGSFWAGGIIGYEKIEVEGRTRSPFSLVGSALSNPHWPPNAQLK